MEDKTLKRLKTRPTYISLQFAGYYYLYRYTASGKTAMSINGALIASPYRTVIDGLASELNKQAAEYFKTRNK